MSTKERKIFPAYAFNPFDNKVYDLAPLFRFADEHEGGLAFFPKQAQELLDMLTMLVGNDIDADEFSQLALFLLGIRNSFRAVVRQSAHYKVLEDYQREEE